MWISSVANLAVLFYIYFTDDGRQDFLIAPFVTYIDVPESRIAFARVCGSFTYMFVFPGVLFSHAMNMSV